ncbi:MAG: DUF3373 family protein [Elusimicrobiota bacterium]|nr:DUF3373 family protein [Elusimicrobiota bacterium]
MNRFSRSLRAIALALGVFAPALTARAQQTPEARLDAMTRELEAVKKEVQGLKGGAVKESPMSWLTIGGDFRTRHDKLVAHLPSYTQFLGTFTGAVPNTAAVPAKTIRNDSLFTNRFGLDLKARVAENVTMTTRLLMYKTFGMTTSAPTQAGYFADRSNASGVFDGTRGRIPADNSLLVDQAYASWNSIAGRPVWFSAGRRPSTGGAPGNVRQNFDISGSAGTPALLVDYAFDGFTLGAAPDVDALPGLAAKVCYGRAFEAGYRESGGPSLADTDMLGLALIPYETDDWRVDAQYQRGFGIMDTIPGPNVRANLGDLEEYGLNVMRTVRQVGPGELRLFAAGAMSRALPSGDRYNAGFGTGNPGLMFAGTDQKNNAGYAAYVGTRYDFTKTGTKLGAEYNHGSKYWVTFTPAADDIWTSKLGTRGQVYELYLVQELMSKPVSPRGRAFFRVGWQYYNFDYTQSNSWVGAPQRISSLTAADMQFMAPIKQAYDIYTTFEVRF